MRIRTPIFSSKAFVFFLQFWPQMPMICLTSRKGLVLLMKTWWVCCE